MHRNQVQKYGVRPLNEAVLIALDAEEINPCPIRESMGFDMKQMAGFMGVPYNTYRSWEDKNPANHKKMSGAARTLLKICAVKPEVIREVLRLDKKKS